MKPKKLTNKYLIQYDCTVTNYNDKLEFDVKSKS